MKNTTASIDTGPHFLDPEVLLGQELRARRERGCDVDEYASRWGILQGKRPDDDDSTPPQGPGSVVAWKAEVDALYAELVAAALDLPEMSRAEPSAFAGIKNTAPRKIEARELKQDIWKDRVWGAITAAEIALGGPVMPQSAGPWALGVYIVEQNGPKFLPDHAGQAWMKKITPAQLSDDNRIAYANYLTGRTYPQTSLHRNPLREQDGALARGIMYGLLAPGDPRRAARMAYNDAAFSHTRNGIYAAMALAAGLAMGLVSPSEERMFEAAQDVIPEFSRLGMAIRQRRLGRKSAPPFPSTIEGINERHAILSFLRVTGTETIPQNAPDDLQAAAAAWRTIAGREPGGRVPDCPMADSLIALAKQHAKD